MWINFRSWGTGIVPDWRSVGGHPRQARRQVGNQHAKQHQVCAHLRFRPGRFCLPQERVLLVLHARVGEHRRRRHQARPTATFTATCAARAPTTTSGSTMTATPPRSLPTSGHRLARGNSTKISLNVPGPRVGIHLAHWTGDGRCDVMVQNKATGALTLYENQFDAGANSLTFANRGVVTGAATCAQGWGVSIFDRGMRLADIDRRVTAWLNKASGMENVGQIKFSEGWDRANMRFADVESSGRADLIHLNKYTGAATVGDPSNKLNSSSTCRHLESKTSILPLKVKYPADIRPQLLDLGQSASQFTGTD